MTDVLLELSKSPIARKLVSSAGLPIPMPEALARPDGPSTERFLEGKTVLVAGDGAVTAVLASILPRAGAKTLVSGDAARAAIAASAEAYGRQVGPLPIGEEAGERVHALVVDATGFASIADLKQLYGFVHAHVRAVGRSGRVVVIGRPSDTATTLEQAAVENALEGFTRSLAKEIGGKGSTANLVLVEPGAEAQLSAVLRFFLSAASAFVSAQPLRVGLAPFAGTDDPWERPLAGKVALVTGAARGIGEATARILAGEGARVVCLDRPDDDEATSRLARDLGGIPILADVSDPEAGKKIVAELARAGTGVDVVVHNAGVTRDKTIARMTEGGWDLTLQINLAALLRITQELLDTRTLRDGGRIVSLSSIAGIAGNMGQTNYAASKSGVIGFTRYLAKDLRTRGITVNAVAPGFIETRMTAAIPVVIREAGRRLSALGQGGLPEDVARAIAFLSTPGAAGVSGQVLRVCGGALIGA